MAPLVIEQLSLLPADPLSTLPTDPPPTDARHGSSAVLPDTSPTPPTTTLRAPAPAKRATKKAPAKKAPARKAPAKKAPAKKAPAKKAPAKKAPAKQAAARPARTDRPSVRIVSPPPDEMSAVDASPPPSAPLRIAHFSDTHLGYQAYAALAPSGENLRALDIVKAFVAVCREIIAEDPPLVIHSGDMGDRSRLDVKYLILIQQWLAKLADRRPDGTRRQVVVISGNHDQPRHHKEVCFLDLFRGMPGVHVVTSAFTQIDLGLESDAHPSLANVVVHALPHDQLKSVDFEDVRPLPHRTNILVAHGVAGGSELFRRSLGREYAIPTDVLSRDWDYVALGHFHKRGPVPLHAAGSTRLDPEVGRAWYAGSTENMGFRDLRDGGVERGYLMVDVAPGLAPAVTRRSLPIRTMLRLPVVEAAGLTPEEIGAALLERVRSHDVAAAVVGQVVTGTTRDVWALVDQRPAREAAHAAVHYAITPRFTSALPTDTPAGSVALGDLATVLEATATELLGPEQAAEALALARTLLGSALTDPATTSDQPSDPEGPSPEGQPDLPEPPIGEAPVGELSRTAATSNDADPSAADRVDGETSDAGPSDVIQPVGVH